MVLESGDKYSFNEDGSEITIMDVKKLDEGDYTCIARNKAGMSEEEASLRVFGNCLHFSKLTSGTLCSMEISRTRKLCLC